MNVFCRGCRTEIDLNASNCPICLRPRDRSEMLEDARRMREADAAARKRPWLLLGGALALAAGGYAAWTLRGPVLGALGAVRSKADAVMDSATDPKTYAPGASAVSAPVPLEPSAAPATPVAPGASAAPSSASAAPRPAASAPAEPVLPPHDWTLPEPANQVPEYAILVRGWVYDLVTARPVPNATFSFQDRLSGGRVPVSAGPNGYYESIVSKENSGLAPVASVAGYRREPLEENDPPWHDRKAAARKAAAAREPGEMLLTFTSRQDEAVVNIVLIPTKPPENR